MAAREMKPKKKKKEKRKKKEDQDSEVSQKKKKRKTPFPLSLFLSLSFFLFFSLSLSLKVKAAQQKRGTIEYSLYLFLSPSQKLTSLMALANSAAKGSTGATHTTSASARKGCGLVKKKRSVNKNKR